MLLSVAAAASDSQYAALSCCFHLSNPIVPRPDPSSLVTFLGSLKKLTALKVDENQLMYLPDSIGG